MGQETGKHSWPKPAGGYQTITGRRYGRRHAYISFRPTLAKQKCATAEDRLEWQEMEMNSVQRENSLSSKGSFSSVFQAIFPVTANSVHPEASKNKDFLNRKQPVSTKDSEALNCKIFMCDQVMDCDPQILLGSKESSDTHVWATEEKKDDSPHGSNMLSFVNIDSYEPDSSDGEEEDETSTNQSLGLQKRVDDMISELEKEFDHLGDVNSYLYTTTWEEAACSTEEASSEKDIKVLSPERRGFQRLGLVNEQSIDLSHVHSNTPSKQDESESEVCLSHHKSLDCKDSRTSQGEMVVRPKVRKQIDCIPGELKPQEEKREDAEIYSKIEDEDEQWEDVEDTVEKYATLMIEDTRSECSDGECSTAWTSGVDEDPCSSNESWETLLGFDQSELEVQSNGSSLDEEPELNFIPEDQMSLEEGEIPWLSYHEETDSSSDEDPEGMSHFVHPGLFMLDGNNNFEDDSSVSEDFDAEWRFFDDFGEGFTMAQAISYMDPQLFTYMALEERLVQAMEAALAHLESLAIDVEQAHPPASEDVISCLPQITVLEDYCGKEQCCAICCAEYIKEEIATELPCHHVFHKICITLWLRKSGTCPVCRHVLSPGVSDTLASTSFVSDHDAPPSSHSTAGTR
ncbi:E3 ubiquitin-protein ligase Praja-2 [Scleropages formosus]|uniref:E3 ubiquitin-protein ligase Praja-2 n=1 Tax=Scleropages formosus TaxID=113540 RepID=UPI0008785B20|nr:E3 ubiquitin-protein ligase Praja-2 [Scleropages formosus]